MTPQSVIAFANQSKKVAHGALPVVAEKAKSFLQSNPEATILIFDQVTSQQIEIDFRGTPETVRKRVEKALATPSESPTDESEKRAGPGRPKLGVRSKEVTLLPTHWEWLTEQPGGASVTLRKLVDAAMKKYASRDSLRRSQEATYKFLHAIAGDRENYEDALRALYARDKASFRRCFSTWPKDIRDHALRLANFA